MSESSLDTARAYEATKAIIDGRNVKTETASILVTAEHAIATVLLMIHPNPRLAASMLNEGLVPAIESRLTLAEKRMRK